jgi:GT2 family glycosyltransferase
MQDRMDAPESIPLRVSALIVSRNCAAALRQTLAALQTYEPREALEVLVVDNGSRDESARLDAEFPEVQYLRLPKNFGLGKALNIGIRTAKGEFVFWLPPNAAVQPGTIARLLGEFDRDPSVGAACPWTGVHYRMPGPTALREFWKTNEMLGKVELPRSTEPAAVEFPMGAPVLVRRGFLTGMNYFDASFGSFGVELELYWRLRDAGKRVVMVPDAPVELVPMSQSGWGAVESADVAQGVAAFLGKHSGFGAELGFKLGAMGDTLLRALTFRSPGYNLKRFAYLLSGQKIDGTQE